MNNTSNITKITHESVPKNNFGYIVLTLVIMLILASMCYCGFVYLRPHTKIKPNKTYHIFKKHKLNANNKIFTFENVPINPPSYTSINSQSTNPSISPSTNINFISV
jgi:hypothetical protein